MTSTQQPTQNKYIPGHKPTHIQNHTWRTAENSCAYLLPTLQAKVQETPNLKALDCGCGPGTISASLASYFPQGHIIATDLSPDVVNQASTHAKNVGITNMSTQVASIFELPFEDNEFDLVHAQQILCHLSEPLPAVKEMLRVCKPGGIVALRECDMRMWCFYPETEGMKELHKAIMKTFEASGGSVDMGPRLVSLALKAGVKRDDVKVSLSKSVSPLVVSFMTCDVHDMILRIRTSPRPSRWHLVLPMFLQYASIPARGYHMPAFSCISSIELCLSILPSGYSVRLHHCFLSCFPQPPQLAPLIRNDQASMGTWCYSTREERQVWLSTFAYRLREGGMRKEILEKELGWTAEQLDDMADECEKFIEAEDGCFGVMQEHG
jgi:ubiquinone/menaquinone biosynthesis C-methylase UbiE